MTRILGIEFGGNKEGKSKNKPDEIDLLAQQAIVQHEAKKENPESVAQSIDSAITFMNTGEKAEAALSAEDIFERQAEKVAEMLGSETEDFQKKVFNILTQKYKGDENRTKILLRAAELLI